MPKQKRRSFTQAFKLAALSRMATAPSIVGLAQELGLERKLLYCWRDGFENGGSAALRQAGRPAQASLLDAEALPAPGPALGEDANASRARRQIEELQRKIGQQ